MGVDLKSTAIDTSTALRTSERATQFTGRFQTAPRLNARQASFPIFPISIVQVELSCWFVENLRLKPGLQPTAIGGTQRHGTHSSSLVVSARDS